MKRFKLISSFIVILIAAGLLYLNSQGLFPPFSSTQHTVNFEKFEISELEVSEVVQNLEIPWAISFTNDDKFFFSERTGRVWEVVEGVKYDNPILDISEVVTGGEGGLMGLITDPRFSENRFVYLCHTYKEEETIKSKVVRYQYNEGLEYPLDLISNIPAGSYHAGCEIAFGPDGKLYVTTGDGGNKELSQQLSTLAGKILRLDVDGTVPTNNPFTERPGAKGEIFSYGLRNSQGLAWDEVGNMYATEHGPSGFDGPPGHDEINLIKRAGNYGWPLAYGEVTNQDMVSPIISYTPAIAPASIEYYNSEMFPELKGYFLVATLRGNSIIALRFKGDHLEESKTLMDGQYGRIREIKVAPDGSIYFATSNTDGRGNPGKSDDTIYRLYRN